MTIYNTVPSRVPRLDRREVVAEFDGVRIVSLPRMTEENGEERAAWRRILPFSHADDCTLKMETAGKKYNAPAEYDRETKTWSRPADDPRWYGRIVIYATARWQPGNVVKVSLWDSEYTHPSGTVEHRKFWRLEWTASPQIEGRELVWIEVPGENHTWGEITPHPLMCDVMEGGPPDARMTGALAVRNSPAPVVFAEEEEDVIVE